MLDNVWTSNETICLFTDSAGGRDKGFSIYFQGKWAQGCWPKEWADNGILSIDGLEFLLARGLLLGKES
jgi:hypothetical protein